MPAAAAMMSEMYTLKTCTICCRHLFLTCQCGHAYLTHAAWQRKWKGRRCQTRPFGVCESVCFTSAGDCDWVKKKKKCPCSCRLSWVCAHMNLNHTREGCPIYLCASLFPCNCVDETHTGGAGCVSFSAHLTPSHLGAALELLKVTERSIKGDCKRRQCAVFGSYNQS